MNRLVLLLGALLLATLACTLTGGDDPQAENIRTPSPVVISQAETANAQATRDLSASPTPVSAPPTRLPTLFPTPVQFNTPIPNVAAALPPTVVSNTDASGQVASGSGAGGITASGVDPAAGAPQQNGYYYPNTIIYNRNREQIAIGLDGTPFANLGAGSRASRSLNGLFVALVSSGITIKRPDGTNIAQGSGQTTLPSWSRDGATAMFGSGNNLVRFQNGGLETLGSVNGDLITVDYSPDGGSVLFASRNDLRVLRGDGSVQTMWDSGSESISFGPVWANRDGGELGVYLELDNGRRLFFGNAGLSEISDPAIHLQLRSPVTEAGRVYIRARNDGFLTLVAQYPGTPDVEFQAPSMQDVSWSPYGSQLVFASPQGDLVLLDTATGDRRTISTGGARAPLWTAPQYLVRN